MRVYKWLLSAPIGVVLDELMPLSSGLVSGVKPIVEVDGKEVMLTISLAGEKPGGAVRLSVELETFETIYGGIDSQGIPIETIANIARLGRVGLGLYPSGGYCQAAILE